MQERIKRDPFSVLKLRATFLKMTSMLDLQLVRILQSESADAASVSEHYSSTIVDFVRVVLEIVPISIFEVLSEIIQLKTNTLKDLPSRMERTKLKQFAQLEEREKLAGLTKEISILTSGVLAMKTTLMGVITVDPKQMLEEGIRKQLIRKIIAVLYTALIPPKPEAMTTAKFLQIIEAIAQALNAIRHSFEYMGDYVNMDGLRIWHHEFNRVMCFLQEQESNRFLKKKILSWQSEYQSKVAPIALPKLSGNVVTCLGQLMWSIVDLTKHDNGTYCPIVGGWLHLGTGDEVLGTKTISKMCNAIGIEGTSAVDAMLSFLLAEMLKAFFNAFEKGGFSNFSTDMDSLLKLWPHPPQNPDIYGRVIERLKGEVHEWTALIVRIGQVQLLKATIGAHMKLKCELEAQALYFMLVNTNATVLQAIKQFYRDPTHNPYPSSSLISALSAYLENSGICEPLEKIYTLAKLMPEVSMILFLLTFLNLNNPKLREEERLHMLIRPDYYDHFEFIVGIITILRQLNVKHTYAFLAFIGQYANFMLAAPGIPGVKREVTGGIEISRPLKNVMIFVKDYETLSKTPRRMMDTFISPTIFDFLSI
jgi:WASH complex subunit strumpellin